MQKDASKSDPSVETPIDDGASGRPRRSRRASTRQVKYMEMDEDEDEDDSGEDASNEEAKSSSDESEESQKSDRIPDYLLSRLNSVESAFHGLFAPFQWRKSEPSAATSPCAASGAGSDSQTSPPTTLLGQKRRRMEDASEAESKPDVSADESNASATSLQDAKSEHGDALSDTEQQEEGKIAFDLSKLNVVQDIADGVLSSSDDESVATEIVDCMDDAAALAYEDDRHGADDYILYGIRLSDRSLWAPLMPESLQ